MLVIKDPRKDPLC